MMALSGQAVGSRTLMRVVISTTRAATLMSRVRRVSNWARHQLERFGAAALVGGGAMA